MRLIYSTRSGICRLAVAADVGAESNNGIQLCVPMENREGALPAYCTWPVRDQAHASLYMTDALRLAVKLLK